MDAISSESLTNRSQSRCVEQRCRGSAQARLGNLKTNRPSRSVQAQRAAVIQVRTGIDQQGAVHPGLHARGQPFVAGALAVRLPIVDRRLIILDGDQIVFCQQTIFAQRSGKRRFGIQTSEVFKTSEVCICKKILPPAPQIRCVGKPCDLFRRDADQVLLDEAMKIFAFLLVFLVLQSRFGLHGRIRQTIQITKLESLGAIYVILQGGLRKSNELHISKKIVVIGLAAIIAFSLHLIV